MSKILVLDDQQFQELKQIFESTMYNSYIPQDMEITSFYHSIRCAFENAEKENCSVLKWYPITEKPNEGKVIVQMRDGSYALDYAVHWGNYRWQFQKANINHVKKWAYLPEN